MKKEEGKFCGMLVVAGGCTTDFDVLASVDVSLYRNTKENLKIISSLNQERYAFSLAFCKGCWYAVGGLTNSSDHFSVERLTDLTNEWEYVNPMTTTRRWHAALSCNGFIYAFGGIHKARLKSAKIYDTVANSIVGHQ